MGVRFAAFGSVEKYPVHTTATRASQSGGQSGTTKVPSAVTGTPDIHNR